MKYCKFCLTTNLRPNSSFNSKGICAPCQHSSADNNPNTSNYLARLKEKIKTLKKQSRLKTNLYDCIVGVSAGKDSTRQALWVRDRLKLRPLLVCCSYPPYQMTDIGASNIENLITLGFDLIIDTPAPETSRKLNQLSFTNFANLCKATEMALFASVPRLAIDLNIKIIFWGENPALQVGDSKTLGLDPFDGNNLRYSNTLVEGGSDWMDEVLDESYKKHHYEYPSLIEYKQQHINILYLGPAWDDWTANMNSTFAALSGLTLRPNEEMITGDLTNASMIDEEFVIINMMIKYFKYGFGRATDYANEQIRNNKLSRDEAISLVQKFDGVCDDSIIKKYCKYIQISEKFFWIHVNQSVNRDLFTLTASRPIPKFIVGKDFI